MPISNNSSLQDSPNEEFIFTRTFNAPRELVFKAMTEPERLAHWWGPKGFTWVTGSVDLRPGGTLHYFLRSPGGNGMWGKFVYHEIVPPERLVYVVSFSDEAGNILRHPLSETWPLEVLNTMTLTERDGKTTMSLTGKPINATEEEIKTFIAGHKGMEQGFNGSLDQLDEYLALAMKETSV